MSYWNKLNCKIRALKLSHFSKHGFWHSLDLARICYLVHRPKWIFKLITRLRIGMSHFRGNEFKRSFHSSSTEFCTVISCVVLYIWPKQRPSWSPEHCGILNQNGAVVYQILLFNDPYPNVNGNFSKFSLTIEYIISSQRFAEQLFSGNLLANKTKYFLIQHLSF